MQTNGITNRQKIGLILVIMLLAMSISLHASRKNEYAPNPPTTEQLVVTNPLVLQNWLPSKSYDYTIARLTDYANAQNLDASSVTIASGIGDDGGAYAFTVTYGSEPTQYHIDVLVSNFASIISTSVSIEGVRQYVSAPSSSNGTSFNGIDSLLNKGLSSIQANNLRAAFMKFKPSARSIDVDTTSVTNSTIQSGNSTFRQLLNFSVAIDSRNYTAQVDDTDISAVSLKLFDSNNKAVFNSGTVDSAN